MNPLVEVVLFGDFRRLRVGGMGEGCWIALSQLCPLEPTDCCAIHDEVLLNVSCVFFIMDVVELTECCSTAAVGDAFFNTVCIGRGSSGV